MNNKQHVSLNQVALLVPTAAWGGTFYLFREVMARSGRAGWLAQAVSGIPVMIITYWLLSLTKFYPEQTILEILQKTTGKLVGGIFCLLYGIIIVILSVLNLMQFSLMVKSYLLPVSPILYPAMLTILTAGIIASKGIEPLARSTLLCTSMLVLIAFFVVMVGGVGFFEWPNVIPIFDRDFKAFLSGMFVSAGLISELLLFLMVMVKFLPNPHQKSKPIMLFTMNAALIPASVDFMVCGIYSPEETRRALFLAVAFTQTIKYGTFLQWMDIFFFILFVMGAVFKLAVNLYSGKAVLSQIFGGKYQPIILIAIALAIFFPLFFTPSMDEVDYLYLLMAEYVIWPFIVLVLTITTLGVWLKNRR